MLPGDGGFQARQDELTDLRQRYNLLVRALGLMIYDYDVATGAIIWSGETERVCGMTAAELNGGVAQWEEAIHPDDRPIALELLNKAEAEVGQFDVEYRFRHKNGSYVWVLDRGAFLPGPDGKAARMIGMMQNIDAIKQLETERLRAQAEVIAAQKRMLRELSTPLVPITNEAVALPLIGAIDAHRAGQIMETLLEGVTAREASVVIIDITGVTTVDTLVANTLVQVARAVRLIGARVILTGISAEIAQTLVGLGADLRSIETRATLQDGIALALQLTGKGKGI